MSEQLKLDIVTELLKYKICFLNSLDNFLPGSWRKLDKVNILFMDAQVKVWLGSTKNNNFRAIFIRFEKVCYQFNLGESSVYLLRDGTWEFIAKNKVINEALRITLLWFDYKEQDNTKVNIKIYSVETIYLNILVTISLIRAKHKTINPKFFDYNDTRSYFKFINWFIYEQAEEVDRDKFLRKIYEQSNARTN